MAFNISNLDFVAVTNIGDLPLQPKDYEYTGKSAKEIIGKRLRSTIKYLPFWLKMDTRRSDSDVLRISLYGIDSLSQSTLQYDDYFSMILNACYLWWFGFPQVLIVNSIYKKACYRPVGLKLYLKRGAIDVLVFLIEFSTCMHQV